MYIQIGWNRIFYLSQKAQKLLMTMALLSLGDHLPCGDIQSRKQGGGTVANVVMSDTLGITQS